MLELSERRKWLLVLIDSIPYVNGNTRLQKYALFVWDEILKNEEFYDDWKPWKFGGYSQKLEMDLKESIKSELVYAHQISTYNGKPVYRYTLTDIAKKSIQDFQKINFETVLQIYSITKHYFRKPIKKLLAESYEKFPQFIDESTIRPEVAKTQLETNSELSKEFEIPIEPEKFDELEIGSDISVKEHVYNDEDLRERLAKIAGLDSIPSLDNNAFDRLSGLISNKLKKKIDSVEEVNSVRGL